MSTAKEIPNFANFLKFKKLQGKPYPFPDQPFFTKMIYGNKGTSKTTLGLSVPGDVLVMCYEDSENVNLPIKRFFGNDERFQVKSFDQFISEENGEIWKESSNLAFDLSIKFLKILASKEIQFDWVITDGYQRLTKIAEMKMRYKNNIGAFAGVSPRTIWNERMLYLNEYFRLVKKIAKYGVIFTSQNKITETKGDDGTMQEKEPSWQGKLKDDASTVIYTSLEMRTAGQKIINKFFANVQNCKITGISKRFDITIKLGENDKIINSPIIMMKQLLQTNVSINLNW